MIGLASRQPSCSPWYVATRSNAWSAMLSTNSRWISGRSAKDMRLSGGFLARLDYTSAICTGASRSTRPGGVARAAPR